MDILSQEANSEKFADKCSLNYRCPDFYISLAFANFSFSFAAFKSALIWDIVLGLGIDNSCKRNPKEVNANPIVTKIGRSTLTTATDLECSHSGQTEKPMLSMLPFSVVVRRDLPYTHSADLPSFVVMSLKLDDVA